MSRNQVTLLVVLAALVAVVTLKGGRQAPDPAETTAAEQAIAVARAAGQPVLLSFRSDSCIPCRAMGDILSEVRPKYEGRVAFVDISLEPDTPDLNLITEHQIQVKPTTILLAADGTVLETKLGVWEPAELAARLDRIASR